MKRILLIDNSNDQLELMKEALKEEINYVKANNEVEVCEFYICCADGVLTTKKLDELMSKIISAIEDKLVIVIDLNLVCDEEVPNDKLFEYLTSGIQLKEYIEERLNENKNKNNIKFIFVSRFFDKDGNIKNDLVKLMDGNDYVLKPPVSIHEKKYVKGLGADGPKKKCELYDKNWKDKIEEYYTKGTSYGNFIGTILEKLMG